ncbi:putative heme-dependent peroxidase [Lentibacillus sp. JNUCC-1]|uniref:hydrogen peroxide-dependent heme synthase n=1 Tax=Lentibacillus sp. JNUCC-1 TaxID=2654513 RepID=UPI0012E6F07A|nr:hydrogen peroxide-dependent heme synthase [Lentibacillus sp. JNUCC-1]MUV36459.1 putative heme-dependent peroxidase [Lentibacillus sp. JNUCC-1]
MVETVETYDGWYALHDFRTMDWEKWEHASETTREKALHELRALLDQWQVVEDQKQGSHKLYSIVGQKADLLFMVLRPEMKDLNQLENALNKTAFAHFTKPAYSFVSIIEKSSYTKPETDPYQNPDMVKKLFPTIPNEDYICFYPMSKLRAENHNWYQLEKEERGRMMFDHIKTAKPFTENVKRIITGAMGLDDYEWGVSLFCDDPLHFKKLIYDTRFDEVSARYGIFGSFYIGHRIQPTDVERYFTIK